MKFFPLVISMVQYP